MLSDSYINYLIYLSCQLQQQAILVDVPLKYSTIIKTFFGQ